MAALGWNHVDLLTEDMQATVTFYEDVLGFRVVRRDLVDIEGTGVMQHVFIDIGNGQMIAFSSGEDAEGYPKGVDTGINAGLGVGGAVYHFAFEAGSEEALDELRDRIAAHGVDVTGPFDHEGWCKSIYFKDPNGLQLEYCVLTRELTPEDALPALRFRYTLAGEKIEV